MTQFRLSARFLPFLLLPCFLALIGCGGEPKLGQVPATAIVKVDGVAVEGAAVIFVDAAGNSSSGLTDKNGVAIMRSSIAQGNKMVEVNGVMPGDYQVGLSKSETKQAPNPSDPNLVIVESVNYIIPVRYNSHLQSGLTASVKKGEPNEFTFELTK